MKNINNEHQTSSVTKTPRDTNLELFRILVMLTIVAHHYVTNSGLMNVPELIQNPSSLKSIFYYLL